MLPARGGKMACIYEPAAHLTMLAQASRCFAPVNMCIDWLLALAPSRSFLWLLSYSVLSRGGLVLLERPAHRRVRHSNALNPLPDASGGAAGHLSPVHLL